MAKTETLAAGGKNIILLDFSNSSQAEIFKLFSEAKEMIRKQPAATALTLTDVSNTKFNTEIINGFKEFTEHNKPYVKAGAVVGVTGLIKIAYQSIITFSARNNLKLFNSREEAVNWLTSV